MAAIGATVAAAAVVLWRRLGPSTYVRIPTMFGTARIYQVLDDAGDPVRLLEVGGIVQSGTYLDERYADLVFEYLKRYDLMFHTGRDVRRVAVLGCGGYDYPEHLVAHHPEVVCDAVEIDPAITAIARRYFHLDRIIEEYDAEREGRLNLVCADALEFLESRERGGLGLNEATGDRGALAGQSVLREQGASADPSEPDDQRAPGYDAIVNDTFDAGTPPAHLTTLRFYRAVHARLNPGGLFLTNIVSPLEGPDAAFLHEQVALMKRVFANVRIYPCTTDELSEADNVIVIASDEALPH